MSSSRYHVWYNYKSGLGAELVRLAPLLKRLVGSRDVCITSFHSFLYDHRFDKHLLHEESEPNLRVPEDEVGVCFTCGLRENGPASWPSMVAEARRRGWPIIDEDLGQKNVGTYEAAARLAQRLVPTATPTVGQSVLRMPPQRHKFLILNIFGGSAVEKGIANAVATRSLVSSLGKAAPNLHWVVPALPHQGLGSVVEEAEIPNVSLMRFDYGDPALAELFWADAVVTVEGGGMHVAVEYGVPTLLVSSPEWIAATSYFLPNKGLHATILGDMAAANQEDFANGIAEWALNCL
jgi:hypothetical protein